MRTFVFHTDLTHNTAHMDMRKNAIQQKVVQNVNVDHSSPKFRKKIAIFRK